MKKISFRDQNRVLHQAVNTIISTVKFGISIMGTDSLLEPQVTIWGTAGNVCGTSASASFFSPRGNRFIKTEFKPQP